MTARRSTFRHSAIPAAREVGVCLTVAGLCKGRPAVVADGENNVGPFRLCDAARHTRTQVQSTPMTGTAAEEESEARWADWPSACLPGSHTGVMPVSIRHDSAH